MSLFRRKKAPPYQARRLQPEWPGAYYFTLRSVPRHHDGIRAVIDGRPGSRCWFSEPLAYLRGQGVSLFRVEARDFAFLPDLYAWWAETERSEAFTFDIRLYFNNNEFVTSLRNHTPDEIQRIIQEGAPRVPADPASLNLTPATQGV
ncbi:MAG: hypothetical protein DCC58_21085 [Chloroflexi bacterium]|nr:MAG: hypothetical protein DCC58_21085 [Chloroflexota bacterium]